MANIAINNFCNMKCPYCFANEFIEEKKEMINEEQLDKILLFLKNSTILNRIGIIGGEPSIHPNFISILKKIQNLAAEKNATVRIFSNGLELYNYINLFNNNTLTLLNVNHPNIIGINNFNKIKLTLYCFKEQRKMNQVDIGINLYPKLSDYNYIIDLANKFNFSKIRCSYVAPACQYQGVNKTEYYNNAKPLFLNFVKDCKKNNIQINLDCNHIPFCYFSSEEKELMNGTVGGWHNLCNPVIDITPDFKATSCFGAYELIDLNNFNTLEEVENYCLFKKMYPRRLQNNEGKCAECQKFINLSCQGGCLAFTNNKGGSTNG